MRLLNKIGLVSASVLTLGVIASSNNDNTNDITFKDSKSVIDEILTCDGVEVTKNCVLNGEIYEKYIYHPATEEVSHYENIIIGYKEVIVGYCTLCNDGTRSPSCSTGSGTCSHHGGVREWNAPIYKEEAIYEMTKVIEEPAKDEWYEIIKLD